MTRKKTRSSSSSAAWSRRTVAFFVAAGLLAILLIALGLTPFLAVIFTAPLAWCGLILASPTRVRRRVFMQSLPVGLIGLAVGITVVHRSLAEKTSSTFDLTQVPLAVATVGALIITTDLIARLVYGLARRFLRSRALSVGLTAVVVFVVFVPMAYVFFNAHRLKLVRVPVVEFADLSSEEVAFRSDDGLTLRGTLIHHGEPRPGIVFCHGVSANRGGFLSAALHLANAGYTVLTYDARAHGQSDGHRISFGLWESRDASRAISALLERRDVVRGDDVAIVGTSMGGATALLAGCRDERVAAVVADASFSSLVDITRYRVSRLPGVLQEAALTAARWCARIQVGVAMEEVDPTRCLRGLERDLPVLILHGEDDLIVPPAHARVLDRAARNSTLVRLVGGGHSKCLASNRMHEMVVAPFLRRHLP